MLYGIREYFAYTTLDKIMVVGKRNLQVAGTASKSWDCIGGRPLDHCTNEASKSPLVKDGLLEVNHLPVAFQSHQMRISVYQPPLEHLYKLWIVGATSQQYCVKDTNFGTNSFNHDLVTSEWAQTTIVPCWTQLACYSMTYLTGVKHVWHHWQNWARQCLQSC